MKRNKLFWGLLIFCAIDFCGAYLLLSLPAGCYAYPVGTDGQANGWGPKSTVLIMAALPALMLILMAVLPAFIPSTRIMKSYEAY